MNRLKDYAHKVPALCPLTCANCRWPVNETVPANETISVLSEGFFKETG